MKYEISYQFETDPFLKEYSEDEMSVEDYVNHLEALGCHDIEVMPLPEENIRVLVVKPEEEPEERTIENMLEAMQEIVGGYIETVTLEDELVLICNEEGKLNGLPMNRTITEPYDDMICGTFLLAGVDGEYFASLSEEKIERMKDRFSIYFNLKEKP